MRVCNALYTLFTVEKHTRAVGVGVHMLVGQEGGIQCLCKYYIIVGILQLDHDHTLHLVSMVLYRQCACTFGCNCLDRYLLIDAKAT